jgi:hypothetical protein
MSNDQRLQMFPAQLHEILSNTGYKGIIEWTAEVRMHQLVL